MHVLRTEPGISVRTASVFSHRAISPALGHCPFDLSRLQSNSLMDTFTKSNFQSERQVTVLTREGLLTPSLHPHLPQNIEQ